MIQKIISGGQTGADRAGIDAAFDLYIINDPVPVIKNWVVKRDIKIINIAGRKASKAPKIYDIVKGIIKQVLNSK